MTLARSSAQPAPRSPFPVRRERGAPLNTPRVTTSAAQPDAPATRHYCRSCDYLAVRSRSELRTTNTDEHAIAALASMGESRPAIASGTINTL